MCTESTRVLVRALALALAVLLPQLLLPAPAAAQTPAAPPERPAGPPPPPLLAPPDLRQGFGRVLPAFVRVHVTLGTPWIGERSEDRDPDPDLDPDPDPDLDPDEGDAAAEAQEPPSKGVNASSAGGAARATVVRAEGAKEDSKSEESEAARPQRLSISGLLIDPEGYVLTISDSLGSAVMLWVQTDGDVLSRAEVVGYDTKSTVGVLRIDPLAVDLPPIREQPVEPGLPIFGVGNPYNLGPSLAPGYVTGTGRRVRSGEVEWSDLLQLSLAANTGDQGGPLADAEGRVFGILLTRHQIDEEEISAIEPHGISFGLPIAAALETARGLIASYEEVRQPEVASERPWLGVLCVDVSDPVLASQLDLEPGAGVLVEDVFRNSPAQRAGLLRYDVISTMAGERLSGTSSLGDVLRKSWPGRQVELGVIRAGKPITLEVTLESY